MQASPKEITIFDLYFFSGFFLCVVCIRQCKELWWQLINSDDYCWIMEFQQKTSHPQPTCTKHNKSKEVEEKKQQTPKKYSREHNKWQQFPNVGSLLPEEMNDAFSKFILNCWRRMRIRIRMKNGTGTKIRYINNLNRNWLSEKFVTNEFKTKKMKKKKSQIKTKQNSLVAYIKMLCNSIHATQGFCFVWNLIG